MKHNNLKVCVLGLGKVGLPTAKYCLERRLEVFGYDVNPDAVERAKSLGIIASTEWEHIPDADVCVICVSTGLGGDLPDISNLFDACKKIADKLPSSPLVSIESTIMPGTSRGIYNKSFKKNVRLVHVPHRYWADDQIEHGVKQLRVIGAVDSESLKAGLEFYRDVLEIPLHIARSVEVAELSKITENAYRYVQIAFAEELKMTCEELGLEFEEVRKACNTKWNIEILEARDGILRHCLPKDTRYLISLSDANMLMTSAIRVDEEYIKRLKRQSKLPKTRPKIAICPGKVVEFKTSELLLARASGQIARERKL